MTDYARPGEVGRRGRSTRSATTRNLSTTTSVSSSSTGGRRSPGRTSWRQNSSCVSRHSATERNPSPSSRARRSSAPPSLMTDTSSVSTTATSSPAESIITQRWPGVGSGSPSSSYWASNDDVAIFSPARTAETSLSRNRPGTPSSKTPSMPSPTPQAYVGSLAGPHDRRGRQGMRLRRGGSPCPPRQRAERLLSLRRVCETCPSPRRRRGLRSGVGRPLKLSPRRPAGASSADA